MKPSAPGPLVLGDLSPRERAVVDLALEGKTDDQIAQALDIAVSTVNSYWVRIRGKLGAFSRTEFVSRILRAEAAEGLAVAEASVLALTAEARAARAALARSEEALRLAGGTTWPLHALESMSGGVLVVRDPGVVAYANREALRLLGAERGHLEGRPVWDLTLCEGEAFWERSIRRFFSEPEPRRAVAGLESAHYAVRHDGTNFRVTLVAEAFETPEGTMAVVLFREFLDDMDALLEVLRQPLTVA